MTANFNSRFIGASGARDLASQLKPLKNIKNVNINVGLCDIPEIDMVELLNSISSY